MRTWVAVSRRAGSVTRRRRMTFLVSSLTRPSSGIVNSAVLILLNSSWNVTMRLNFTVHIQKEVGMRGWGSALYKLNIFKTKEWPGHKHEIIGPWRNPNNDTVYNIENRNWVSMLITLHLICVESLYRYQALTYEGDGLTTTPSRCICIPSTVHGGLDTTPQVTSK